MRSLIRWLIARRFLRDDYNCYINSQFFHYMWYLCFWCMHLYFAIYKNYFILIYFIAIDI